MNLCNFSLVFITVAVLTVHCIQAWTGDVVFEDNFEGTSLDLAKWEYQDACDDRKSAAHFLINNLL